jgi:hypothetical protein
MQQYHLRVLFDESNRECHCNQTIHEITNKGPIICRTHKIKVKIKSRRDASIGLTVFFVSVPFLVLGLVLGLLGLSSGLAGEERVNDKRCSVN